MEIQRKCPACGREVNIGEECCSTCKMRNLDQFFVSKADYFEWVQTNLEPYRKILRPKIFAGNSGVLILTREGTLYGWGNNSQGQYGIVQQDMILDAPQKIAENVRSAAAGYNYSIYVTEEGQTVLLGNSGIPYIERFQGFDHAAEVYAAPDKDVFWIVSQTGGLYVWGQNNDGGIVSKTQTDCFRFAQTELEVEYLNGIYEIHVPETNPAKALIGLKHSCISSYLYSQLKQLSFELKQTETYEKYRNKFGEDNLSIEFEQIKDVVICSKKGDNNYQRLEDVKDFGAAPFTQYATTDVYYERRTQKETYIPTIRMENRYIFNPVPVIDPQQYLPVLYQVGSGLVKADKAANINCLTEKIKICRFEVWGFGQCQAILSSESKLRTYKEDDGQILSLIHNVEDVSIADEDVYIVTSDNTVMKSDIFDLINSSDFNKFTKIGQY